MKKGFTLFELMIVIGIIAILAAILLKSVSGSTDSARAAKCLSNMHNLASACQTYALSSYHNRYPQAGSTEYMAMPDKISFKAGADYSATAHETPGWVSWASMGAYASAPKKKQANSSWLISTYYDDGKKNLYALTNGAIWTAINGNASSYRCPLHATYARKQGVSPNWSYVMNSYFGSWGEGSARTTTGLDKRDRLLLFAELPFNFDNAGQNCKYTTIPGKALDPTLQYKGEQEVIGFNHKTKKKWIAHVCFADGHTEKLEMPGDTSLSRLRELTTWLCEGKAITFNGTKYEEVKN